MSSIFLLLLISHDSCAAHFIYHIFPAGTNCSQSAKVSSSRLYASTSDGHHDRLHGDHWGNWSQKAWEVSIKIGILIWKIWEKWWSAIRKYGKIDDNPIFIGNIWENWWSSEYEVLCLMEVSQVMGIPQNNDSKLHKFSLESHGDLGIPMI